MCYSMRVLSIVANTRPLRDVTVDTRRCELSGILAANKHRTNGRSAEKCVLCVSPVATHV